MKQAERYVNYLNNNLDEIKDKEVLSTEKVKYFFDYEGEKKLLVVDLENRIIKCDYQVFDLLANLENQARSDIENHF